MTYQTAISQVRQDSPFLSALCSPHDGQRYAPLGVANSMASKRRIIGAAYLKQTTPSTQGD